MPQPSRSRPRSGLYAGPLPAKSRWLRASPQTNAGSAEAFKVGVDRANRRILGIILAEEGVFKDERGWFNDQSLRCIVALAKAKPNGLRSRFGHPSVSEDAL